MGRNMLAGAAGDELNAMLAAVGFDLAKLKRGPKLLFLSLRTETDGFAEFLAFAADRWRSNAGSDAPAQPPQNPESGFP